MHSIRSGSRARSHSASTAAVPSKGTCPGTRISPSGLTRGVGPLLECVARGVRVSEGAPLSIAACTQLGVRTRRGPATRSVPKRSALSGDLPVGTARIHICRPDDPARTRAPPCITLIHPRPPLRTDPAAKLPGVSTVRKVETRLGLVRPLQWMRHGDRPRMLPICQSCSESGCQQRALHTQRRIPVARPRAKT